METTITGIFASQELASLATEQLLAAGFGREQISIVMADTQQRHRLVHADTEDRPRGAITGVAVGGAFGAILAGALALPGIGVFAAGPLLAALTAGSVGAAAGGVIGTLVGAAVGTQVEAEYEHMLDQGAVLLGVHSDHAHAQAARDLLAAAGGKSISDAVHRANRQAAADA